MNDTQEDPLIFNDGQLSLIGQECEQLSQQIIQKYGNQVTRLDLSFNCFRSVEWLCGFPNIQELILDNNSLTDGISFPEMQHLHTLMLNKNDIRDLDQLLDNLAVSLPKLSYLSLLGNTACPNQLSNLEKDEDDYRRYRLYVLHKLPKLKFLDSSPAKDSEKHESLRVGSFLKVVRPQTTEEESVSTEASSSKSSVYSPLPDRVRENPDHKATFGKCRYVYYGKHSEGNRFIRNNDL